MIWSTLLRRVLDSMADCILINEHSSKGKLGISRKLIASIVDEAVNRILAASEKNNNLKVVKPTAVSFKKDGKVEIDVSIVISKKANPEETCQKIQEEIAHDLAIYTESLPFEILISIVDVK